MWIEALFEAQKVQLYDGRGSTVQEVLKGSTARYELGREHKRVRSKERRRRQRVSRIYAEEEEDKVAVSLSGARATPS